MRFLCLFTFVALDFVFSLTVSCTQSGYQNFNFKMNKLCKFVILLESFLIFSYAKHISKCSYPLAILVT